MKSLVRDARFAGRTGTRVPKAAGGLRLAGDPPPLFHERPVHQQIARRALMSSSRCAAEMKKRRRGWSFGTPMRTTGGT